MMVEHHDAECAWAFRTWAPTHFARCVNKLVLTEKAMPLENALGLIKQGAIQAYDVDGF